MTKLGSDTASWLKVQMLPGHWMGNRSAVRCARNMLAVQSFVTFGSRAEAKLRVITRVDPPVKSQKSKEPRVSPEAGPPGRRPGAASWGSRPATATAAPSPSPACRAVRVLTRERALLLQPKLAHWRF